MINHILRTIVYFVFFTLLQVLVLNNIHYLRLATPFLYLYCLIKLPVGISRSQMLLLSFAMGWVIDMFSNTPGLHTAACTLVGFIREPMIRFLKGDDVAVGNFPSYESFGYKEFIRYVVLFVVIHHLFLFLIEALSFFDPLFLALRIGMSIITTVVLIFIVELFNFESQKIGE